MTSNDEICNKCSDRLLKAKFADLKEAALKAADLIDSYYRRSDCYYEGTRELISTINSICDGNVKFNGEVCCNYFQAENQKAIKNDFKR
jgi:hypothetical protein